MLRHLLCRACVCGTEKNIQIPCSANYAICRAACVTTVLLCCACVCGTERKNYSNPLLSKLRDFPRRVVCSGVFVIRTCVRCPNTKILRESVRCLVCSLSELFVNRSPTVYRNTHSMAIASKILARIVYKFYNTQISQKPL